MRFNLQAMVRSHGREDIACLPDLVPLVPMQMIGILARMETLGIPFHPGSLLTHRRAAVARIEAIGARAAALNGGREFNVASAAQLAKVLYEDLGLPVPFSAGGSR